MIVKGTVVGAQALPPPVRVTDGQVMVYIFDGKVGLLSPVQSALPGSGDILGLMRMVVLHIEVGIV